MNKSKTRNVKKPPGRPPRENTKRRTVIFDNDLWKSLKIMAIVERCQLGLHPLNIKLMTEQNDLLVSSK